VTVDILSAHTGVITKYHAKEGDTVPVGANFMDIDTAAAAGSAQPQAAAAPKKEAAPQAATPTPAAAPKAATPAVAPAAPVTHQTAPASKPGVTNSVTSKTAPTAISGSRVETRVGMSKMRQTIARRLKES